MRKFIQICFLLFSAISFAQSKFIEVEVRDTIALKPASFEYIIRVYDPSPDDIDEENDYDVKAEKKKYSKYTENLKKLLKSNKYNFRAIGDTDFDLNSASFYLNSGFIVLLNNSNELQGLKTLLGDLDYVSASLGNVTYRDEADAEDRLMKKLIEKAIRKAAVIAEASGLKAGMILEVKELGEMDDFQFNVADTYFVGRNNKNLEMQNGSLAGNLSRALVVKFAAE